MKKVILLLVMALSTAFAFAQDATTIKNLKEQQKVLALTSKLNKLQLDYEKEKANYNDLTGKVAEANAAANAATTDFNTSDAKSTVKDAKKTVKQLKEVKSINKKFAKSQKKLSKMEKKIAKLQSRIDNLNKGIQFINQ